MKCRAALAPPALQALALGQVEAQELELARVNDETSKGTYDYLLRAGFQASKPTSTFSAGTAEANARPRRWVWACLRPCLNRSSRCLLRCRRPLPFW